MRGLQLRKIALCKLNAIDVRRQASISGIEVSESRVKIFRVLEHLIELATDEIRVMMKI